MKLLHTNNNAFAVADSAIDEWFEQIKNDSIVLFATNTQLNKLRYEHAVGHINVSELRYNDYVITINEKGILSEHPRGLCEENTTLIQNLLTLQCRRPDVVT